MHFLLECASHHHLLASGCLQWPVSQENTEVFVQLLFLSSFSGRKTYTQANDTGGKKDSGDSDVIPEEGKVNASCI